MEENTFCDVKVTGIHLSFFSFLFGTRWSTTRCPAPLSTAQRWNGISAWRSRQQPAREENTFYDVKVTGIHLFSFFWTRWSITRWPVTKVVSRQGCSPITVVVTYHQGALGCLPSVWSITHPGILPLGWSITRVVYN